MRLRYTFDGLAELDEVLTSIEGRSPQGARKVKRSIQTVTDMLLRHPYVGQLTPRRHLRRISAFPYPYLIFYQVTENEIIVHGIRHGARNPRSMPGHSDT